MRKFHRGVMAFATAVATCLSTGATAHAALDTTAPVLHTPVKAHFIVGSQISQYTVSGEYFYTVPQRVEWSATDDSGNVAYAFWEYYAGDDPSQLTDFTEDTFFRVSSTDYDDQFGGGSFATTNWAVQAFDISGNSTQRAVYGAHLTVTQDDGSQTVGHETPDVAIGYTGAWQTASCGCFAAGTTHKSTTAGNAATVTVIVPAGQGVRSVALVMDEAANRGKARILVDGHAVTTVNTHAASPLHKVVVWQTRLGVGTHTIKIVNLATAGHPRIDLDAVVVN